MEIFHYVADQLKDTPLFESDMPELSEENDRTGAVYNDFDTETPFPDTPISTLEPSQECNEDNERPVLTRGEVDSALLYADENENAFNIHIDSENFDTTSVTADKNYHEKVTFDTPVYG